MANCFARDDEGLYSCGGSYYISDITSNIISFGHYSGDASQALLTISNKYIYIYGNLQWANPSGGNVGLRLCYSSSLENKVQKLYREDQRWSGCATATNILTGDFTGRISASDSTVKIWGEGRNSPSQGWLGTSTGSPDFCDIVITLTNDQKILPPKGLTASLQNISEAALDVTASIESWSDNQNIVGTPYTQGGGRNWNFMAEIKTERSTASTTIKRIELNTGENKTATFNFAGLSLVSDTTYWVRIVVSNDFQQTQDIWLSFTTKEFNPFYGSLNEKAKPITKFYGSVGGNTKLVKKFYGSVGGNTKRIY